MRYLNIDLHASETSFHLESIIKESIEIYLGEKNSFVSGVGRVCGIPRATLNADSNLFFSIEFNDGEFAQPSRWGIVLNEQENVT